MLDKIHNLITYNEKLLKHIKKEEELKSSDITNLIVWSRADLSDLSKSATTAILDSKKSILATQQAIELIKNNFAIDLKEQIELTTLRKLNDKLTAENDYLLNENSELKSKIELQTKMIEL